MNIREAILKAADHVQTHQDMWCYSLSEVPECGSPGCALGWIGHFANIKGDAEDVAVAMGLPKLHDQHGVGYHQWEFYDRVQQLVGEPGFTDRHRGPTFLHLATAAEAAHVMRLYADVYHPAEKHHGIPSSVRAIFETAQSELV